MSMRYKKNKRDAMKSVARKYRKDQKANDSWLNTLVMMFNKLKGKRNEKH